jgi:hypothetical protein
MNVLTIRRADKLPDGYRRVRTKRIRYGRGDGPQGRSIALEDAIADVRARHGADVVYLGGDARFYVWAVPA